MTTAADRLICNQVRDTIIASSLVAPETGAAIDDTLCMVDYLPRMSPELYSDLRIVVLPRSRSLARATRATLRRELGVQIAVIQRCNDPAGDLFAGLVDLTTDIDELLANAQNDATLTSVTRYGHWLRSELMLYDVQMLESKHVFQSLITATFSYIQ